MKRLQKTSSTEYKDLANIVKEKYDNYFKSHEFSDLSLSDLGNDEELILAWDEIYTLSDSLLKKLAKFKNLVDSEE